MAPPRSPETLMDEMVEEVLLRCPPDEPKTLLRAALVCKRWRRIVSDRGFRRRFRDRHRHRTPPMLGFMFGFFTTSRLFVPAGSFRTRRLLINGPAIDARHGRVLLHTVPWRGAIGISDSPFEVWNPISGKRRSLPLLPRSPEPLVSWNAALFRRNSNSLVVFVGTDRHEMFSYVYSSESASWSKRLGRPRPVAVDHPFALMQSPSALVGNVLFFMIRSPIKKCILKYDLAARKTSLFHPPSLFGPEILMTTERGGLGLATVRGSELYLWSWEARNGRGSEEWALDRVIQLKPLLPADADFSTLEPVGFAEGAGVIFLWTEESELFTLDLKSLSVAKVSAGIWLPKEAPYVLPYVNFYTPVRAASKVKGPTAGAPASSA